MRIVPKVFLITVAILLLIVIWIIGGFIIGMCSDFDSIVAAGVASLIILAIIWAFIVRATFFKNDIENPNNKNKQIGRWVEALVFFVPLLSFIYYKRYKSEGSEPKIKALLRWTLFGLCFYLGLLLIITHLDELI